MKVKPVMKVKVVMKVNAVMKVKDIMKFMDKMLAENVVCILLVVLVLENRVVTSKIIII